MEPKTWLLFGLPAAALGAAFGVVLTQVVDIWKTSTLQRHELQRRFFDVKFEAALDLAKSLDAVIFAFKARFAEAVEWTREDENFIWLDLSRDVLTLHADALTKNFERYVAAYAVMDLVFPSSFADSAVWRDIGVDLDQAWIAFDERRLILVRQLNALMPDSRSEELRAQRARGQFAEGVQEEIERWIAVYKNGTGDLRSRLPHIAELTDSTNQKARAAVRALREELKPYSV